MEPEKEVYEPEVLPPEPDRAEPGPTPFETWKGSLGPVVVGLLIDAVDLATFGPVGIRMGFLFGAAATFMICSMYRLPFRKKLLYAVGAGIYCTLPITEFIPLGTLLGTLTCLRK